jgi:uncharacterized protein YndB with AHSA1/START domain
VQCECDWKAGSPWKLVYPDGRVADFGEVAEADPPRLLVLKWCNEWKPELKAEGYSCCIFDLEPWTGAVKLTVTHVIDCAQSKFIEGVSIGWPKVLSNLKSLLETGTAALCEMYQSNSPRTQEEQTVPRTQPTLAHKAAKI